MFRIRYHGRVLEDIEIVPQSDKIRIKKAIETKLTSRPDLFGKPLRRSLAGFRSLRVGAYRVVYLIEGEIVSVLIIAHRRDVYDRATRRI